MERIKGLDAYLTRQPGDSDPPECENCDGCGKVECYCGTTESPNLDCDDCGGHGLVDCQECEGTGLDLPAEEDDDQWD